MKALLLLFAIITVPSVYCQPAYNNHFTFGGKGMTQTNFNGGIELKDFVQQDDYLVFTCFSYSDTVDVNPSASGDAFIFPYQQPYGGDNFILKTDTLGNFLWTFQLNTSASDYLNINGLAVDDADNIYITGDFTGTIDMNPGSGTNTIVNSFPSYQSRGFVAKYNSIGAYQWAFAIGGYNSYSADIEVGYDGNIYVTGTNNDFGDLDPGPGTSTIQGNGELDFFLAKYSPAGVHLDSRTWGSDVSGNGWTQITQLTRRENGNMVIFGYADAGADLDPSAASVITTNEGMVIIELETDFTFVNGAVILAEPYTFFNDALAVDSENNLYVSSRFTGTVDIDPTSNVNSVGSVGNTDHVIMKFDDTNQFLWSHVIGGNANPFTEPQIDLAVNLKDELVLFGDFSGTMDIDMGAGTTNIISNGTRDFFMAKYDDNGDLIWGDKLGGASNEEYVGKLIVSGTNYFIAGHNSANDLDLDFTTDVANALRPFQETTFCAKYSDCSTLNDQSYFDTFSFTLWAEQDGATYQWVDCNNGNAALTGQTNQYFTPQFDSDFAVQVTLGSCTVQSACTTITGAGIDTQTPNSFLMYPNPSSGDVSILLSDYSNVTLTVLDATGKIIFSTIPSSPHVELQLSGGVYFVEVELENGLRQTKKLIVQ